MSFPVCMGLCVLYVLCAVCASQLCVWMAQNEGGARRAIEDIHPEELHPTESKTVTLCAAPVRDQVNRGGNAHQRRIRRREAQGSSRAA